MVFLAQHPGSGEGPPDLLSLLFGVAALLLVAGWAVTRFQRDRLRFALMQASLEKGVTRFPGTPPYWLVSLRQGVTLVALGIGLIIVGSGAWWLAHGVAMPAGLHATTTSPAEISVQLPAGPPEDRAPEPPPRHEGPPGDERDDHPPFEGPPPRHQAGQPHPAAPPLRNDAEPRHPDHRSPEFEHWHQAEAQKTIGLVSVGGGLILALLGLVRVGFAKIEQRYTKESEDGSAY